MNKFMRILIMFDLPTKTKNDRRNASRFRSYLIKDGYIMLQWSVYSRLCDGMDSVQTHKNRLNKNMPPLGEIRVLTLTEKQYESIEILLGGKNKHGADRPACAIELF